MKKGWTKLVTLPNMMEAEILRGYLESSSIEVLVKGEAIGRIHGLTAGPLAEVELWVPAEKFKEAEKLLKGFEGNGSEDNTY